MTREFRYAFSELVVDRSAVVRECGGVGEALAETLKSTIDRLLAETIAHPRAGYVLSGERFETGPTIAELLSGSERVAVFLATLGPEFDSWSRGFFTAGDPFCGFIADAIGSVAVEAVVDRLEEAVAAEAGSDEVSRRASPGYCGWDVADQHRLFGVLPDGFLGVRLTEAALMVPLKSVSGVIGIGPAVAKRDYPCEVCPIEDCPTGRRGRA